MTNNLAKIAKDLRAFAKRCKDVHYSDSLLISFILSGILSLASISFSDTFDNLSDSQKEAAMDSINEMRQQINYARKDNDKLIKGSSLELVKLMEQGDQVVKSPWGSQQFGFGYTYNSWGTSFKGRGGKQNDIKYRRTNDLTKYVYDSNLHEYGATNLHIKRNKEPDALVINPANVHKSYTPPTATRMDTLVMPNSPTFTPAAEVPIRVTTYTPPTNNPSATRSVNGVNVNNKYVRTQSGNNHDATIQTANGIVRYADRDNYNASVGTTTLPHSPYTEITGTFSNGISQSGYSTWLNATTNGQNSRGSNYYNIGRTGITDYMTPDWFYASYWNTTLGSGSTASNISGMDAHYSDWDSGHGNVIGAYVTAWNNEYSSWLTSHPGGSISDAQNYANSRVYLSQRTQSGSVILTTPSGNTTYNDVYRGDVVRTASVLVQNSSVNVKNSIFDVRDDNGSWNSGLEIDLNDGGSTTVTGETFNVKGNSIGLAIDADNGSKDTAINFVNNPVFYLSSNNNIGINIQNGQDSATGKVELTGNHDIHVGHQYSGANNVAYNVTNHVKELNITNGSNPIPGGGLNNGTGLIHLEGPNSIAFSDRGYVESGTVDLKNVHSSNDNNIFAYFDNYSATTTNSGAHETTVKGTNSAIGWFDGTLKLQGIIGAYRGTVGTGGGPASVSNNIAVYGVSGQRNDIARTYITNAANPSSPKALTVEDLHVAFGSRSVNGTMIFADKGTMIDVSGPNGTGAIVDSAYEDMASGNINWGYNNPESSSSLRTTIAYATGVFSPNEHGLATTADPGSSSTGASSIKITSPVDMISREGTAYNATKGGKIEVTGNTRAGGYQSIIAYSVGTVGDLHNTDHFYTTRADVNSQITITGDILAADNNILGKANSSGGNVGTPDAAKVSNNGLNHRTDTYENIGAFAKGKGTITIKTAAKATNLVEDSNSTAAQGSLIYGLAAYAEGEGSKVTYDKTGGGVTVVSGTGGALYATNNGQIEFNGDIVNQDNNLNTVTTITSKATTVAAGTRAGRNANRLNHYDSGNDHEKVTPFYVNRIGNDKASILFNNPTGIDMYDGILLTGNKYGEAVTDYLASAADVSTFTSTDDKKKFYAAKYRGMENVTVDILSDRVDVGVINQAANKIKWDNMQNQTGSSFLNGIAKYAGITADNLKNSQNNNFKSTFINGDFEIDHNVNLEDVEKTVNRTPVPAGTKNDPFTGIKMESELVTINNSRTIKGDVKYKAGQGLSMANSLYRWTDPVSSTGWRKSLNTESGYKNSGTINVWGGTAAGNGSNPAEERITGINVAYGTIKNEAQGTIEVDHGYGIVGTDDSILSNEGSITVTGKYTAGGGTLSQLRTDNRYTAETSATGENYGIMGLSTNNVGYGNNKITIEDKGTVGTITVDGDLAVGIYAKNVNNANRSDVTILYDNKQATAPDSIKLNVNTNDKSDKSVGIVIDSTANSGSNAGGILTLNTQNTATTSDIVTTYNGIGIYAKASNIKFHPDSTGVTIETKNDGVGIWTTDDSSIGEPIDRLGATPKVLNYVYKGDNNKNAFGMNFTSTDTTKGTSAVNYLDVKFNNNNDAGVTLAAEKAAVTAGTPSVAGTYKGIAGILVNTDKGRLDTVTNYGDIKEDKSKTHVRSYGAVVNSGNFVNWGNIELSDSLLSDAANVEKNDLKKVNVGILANDHENGRANTYIESHGDIKVGTTSNQNVGGFGIYGYNVTTGPKADGSESTITINRNSYGIYSGDGTVNIQKGTKLLVGNDTVLGHEQTTKGTSSAAGAYPINRQTAYTAATDLLPGRTTDAAVGVYIGSNENLSKQNRNVDVSANMDIDRYSYGIVLAENNGGATTNVTIGSPTYSPTINLASNTKAGGQVKSHVPTNPAIPEEVYEQGNAVYYYSADKNSKGTTYANVTMNGDYNTAYRTAGSIDNYGTIDLRSQWDIANPTVDKTTGETINLGYGNLGIVSENPDIASTNYGKIITGMSDTQNMRYSAAMAAGRNVYDSNNTFVKTEADGYVINKGNIVVQAKDGIGMFATGSRSRAINYGNIELIGDNSTGMYLDRGAIGENYGTIEGSANNLRGVVAINGGYIKNYGTINVTGQNSNGIVTDSSRFIVDANGNPVKILSPTDAQYDSSQATTAGQNNGKDGSKDLYGGKESSIAEYTSGNPKTTGVGTTIAMPSVVPMTTITVDGVNTPIFTVDTDAATQGQWGEKISITSSIQTGGTRIIDLSQLDGWGNKMWNNYHTDQLSEVTSIGMYVDTSGVKYSNPINGIQNLKNLGEVNLYFGSEATLYTNAKAIRLGTNILKPFNDSLTNLPGGAVVNPLSASLTWQVAAKLDDKNQLTDVYMSKVPYHSFAYDDDTSLVNFTNNLDNVYEIVDFHTNEKEIFNKLNSLGNGEGHILAQAFDQMRAHIYGGIQQRTVATEKIFDSQVSGVMSSNGMVGNPSKDSTKYKAFGERGEYKTDTKGIPDYENYAGGFVAVHEGESIYKGEKHGWYTGVVDNNFSFKDIARSHENQAMIKGGLFKTTPFDVNGEFTWTIAGEGYFGRTDTNRRFWVVDKSYDAESHYYTYGVALKNELAKSFRLSEGFAIKPHVGIDLEYGRYSSFHEDGTMSLDVKGNDYHSIKPNLGVDFTYKQPVFKKSMFVASLGLGYEKELGRVNDVTNEARIQGAWTDYFSIRGDKENKKGNYKADLNLGIDNGRLGFTVNAGYDSTGKNFRGGAGLRFIF